VESFAGQEQHMFSDAFLAELADAVADRVVSRLSTPNAGVKRLLSTVEAAEYMGLPSSSALRQRKAGGQIPASVFVKMGGSVLYDRKGLDDWIDELKQAA
jgi:hypothetical protein